MTISKTDIYQAGKWLRDGLIAEYRDKYRDMCWRVLINSPRNGAWKYGFWSWMEMLEIMGIRTTIVYNINVPENYTKFDILITPADISYFWGSGNNIVSEIPYKIGLASKENEFLITSECTGTDTYNIKMIKELKFDFLITSFSRDFINYVMKEWIDAGIEIIEVPFGFNPRLYYPEDNYEIYDFFFVGTNSIYKADETNKYLFPIVYSENNYGILRGVNWEGVPELHPIKSREFYSMAKINLNYHIKEQKILDSEINERTFVISACGGFQLVDNPKALARFYSTEDMAVSVDEKDYLEKFEYYLNKPEERHEIGMNALIKSYKNKYSLFHRIEKILDKI